MPAVRSTPLSGPGGGSPPRWEQATPGIRSRWMLLAESLWLATVSTARIMTSSSCVISQTAALTALSAWAARLSPICWTVTPGPTRSRCRRMAASWWSVTSRTGRATTTSRWCATSRMAVLTRVLARRAWSRSILRGDTTPRAAWRCQATRSSSRVPAPSRAARLIFRPSTKTSWSCG